MSCVRTWELRKCITQEQFWWKYFYFLDPSIYYNCLLFWSYECSANWKNISSRAFSRKEEKDCCHYLNICMFVLVPHWVLLLFILLWHWADSISCRMAQREQELTILFMIYIYFLITLHHSVNLIYYPCLFHIRKYF